MVITESIPENRIRALHRFSPTQKAVCIDSYIHWLQHGALFLEGDYQRDYVWGEKEQQDFLMTAILGFPLGHIALAKKANWGNVDGPYIEVVDGKQRITTLQLFITDKISLMLPDGPVKWSELTRGEQLSFGRASLPAIELGNATRHDIVEYFVRVNFTGVAQSTDHRKHVMDLLESL
ncbi:DUF262 domain-containing protein [Escherichia coli]